MTNAVKNTLMMAQLSSRSEQAARTPMRARHVSDIMQYGFAAMSLLLLAPLFLIISLLIKLTSRGPVLYRGLRVGKDGHIFTIYKFCTHHASPDEKIGACLLAGRDASYTGIGKLLKCTKLDHLPQLVNVLKGEMNLVGPRPVRPIFLERLCDNILRYPIRLTVKPGMMDVTPAGAGYLTDAKDTLRAAVFHINNRLLLLVLKRLVCKIVGIPKTCS